MIRGSRSRDTGGVRGQLVANAFDEAPPEGDEVRHELDVVLLDRHG